MGQAWAAARLSQYAYKNENYDDDKDGNHKMLMRSASMSTPMKVTMKKIIFKRTSKLSHRQHTHPWHTCHVAWGHTIAGLRIAASLDRSAMQKASPPGS